MVINFRDKAWIFLAIMCFSLLICSTKALVSYDHKALIINGQKRILLSGSIHYPRSTPEVIFFIQLNNLFIIKCKISWVLIKFTEQLLWFFCTWGLIFLVFPLIVQGISLQNYICLYRIVATLLYADVAWSDKEGPRRWFRCYTNLCFLERTWTFSWTSNLKTSTIFLLDS